MATELRAALLQQQRDTRNWLLLAGVTLTGVDVLCAYAMGMVLDLTAENRSSVVRFDLLVVAGIAVIWWVGRGRPVACCASGVLAYWVAQTYVAVIAPKLFMFTLVIKLATTAGMIRSIQLARRAERQLRQLDVAPANLPAAIGWWRRTRR